MSKPIVALALQASTWATRPCASCTGASPVRHAELQARDAAEHFLTTDEVAIRYRTSAGTVRYWRHRGIGPTGTRFGRRVLYSLADLAEYERSMRAGEDGPDAA